MNKLKSTFAPQCGANSGIIRQLEEEVDKWKAEYQIACRDSEEKVNDDDCVYSSGTTGSFLLETETFTMKKLERDVFAGNVNEKMNVFNKMANKK